MEWYTDLVEYYNVTPEQAALLGTRSKGRKPDLPGSATCNPVSGMTFEEIWDSKPRDTTEGIFQFYKDIGSWSSFRQCKFHYDSGGTAYNVGQVLQQCIEQYKEKFPGQVLNILEYGSGVAPIITWLVDNVGNTGDNYIILDVPCEHLTFGEWRLKKRGVNITKIELQPDIQPELPKNLDFVIMTDVLEHMDAPLESIKNVFNSMGDSGVLFETWVHHDDTEAGKYADLDRDKVETIEFIKSNFKYINSFGHNNHVKIWKKNKQTPKKKKQ